MYRRTFPCTDFMFSVMRFAAAGLLDETYALAALVLLSWFFP